jgi:hypothetical protein
MTTANIVDVVLGQFLSALETEAQLPSQVVQSFERLAREDALSNEERVKAAVAGRLVADDEAQESHD